MQHSDYLGKDSGFFLRRQVFVSHDEHKLTLIFN